MGEPGAGSTSNSCAIIRFSYSTHEGVALSWEARAYWDDWTNYIGATDEKGLIKFINKGSIEFAYPSYSHEALQKRYDRVGVRWEYWDREKIKQAAPFFNMKNSTLLEGRMMNFSFMIPGNTSKVACIHRIPGTSTIRSFPATIS